MGFVGIAGAGCLLMNNRSLVMIAGMVSYQCKSGFFVLIVSLLKMKGILADWRRLMHKDDSYCNMAGVAYLGARLMWGLLESYS